MPEGYLEDILEDVYETLEEVSFDSTFNKLPTPEQHKSTIPFESGTFRGIAYHWCHKERIDQDVETTLQFLDNGEVLGSGFDSDDGEYELSGTWKEDEDHSYMLRWKEIYDDFNVKVQCRMVNDDKGTIISGLFRSSRNVKGNVNMELSLK